MAPTTYTPPINTYVPLATITLSSSASSVTFSNIPTSGYRDLILVINGASNSNARGFNFDFNGDTGNKSMVIMNGYPPSGTQSYTDTDLYIITDSSGYMSIIQLMDYSATDKHKTVLIRDSLMASSFVIASAGRWASTAAITSIRLSRAGYNLVAGTTLSLYGIAA